MMFFEPSLKTMYAITFQILFHIGLYILRVKILFCMTPKVYGLYNDPEYYFSDVQITHLEIRMFLILL